MRTRIFKKQQYFNALILFRKKRLFIYILYFLYVFIYTLKIRYFNCVLIIFLACKEENVRSTIKND